MDFNNSEKVGAEYFLKAPVRPTTSESRNENGAARSHLKVEMQTISLSGESQKQVMDTLRKIHGEDFCFDDADKYKDKGSNSFNRYWKDGGNLIVRSGIDYSNENSLVKDQFRIFALRKLEYYGFHTSHCEEALDRCNDDLISSLELLYSKYFVLNNNNNCDWTEEELINSKNDEREVLKSIFDTSFVERDVDKKWTVTLRLDYLLKYSNSAKRKTIKEMSKKPSSKNKIDKCRNFSQGKCRFGNKCRFSHETEEVKPAEKNSEKIELFELEIRFPEGSKYPLEPPLLFLTTTHDDMPELFCLHLCKKLLEEAQYHAANGTPSIFSLAELLRNEEEMENYITRTKIRFIDSTRSLFPSNDTNNINADTLPSHYTKGSTGREHRSTNLSSKLVDDELLAKKFKEKQINPRYKEFLNIRKQLPAWAEMQNIIDVVNTSQVIVISGETGCGKSTQVGQFLLDDWLINRSKDEHLEIVCTQPRRLSAIGVAERVAQERDERCGSSVGYQIRLENKVSRMTRLTFCTTGILLRRFQTERTLESVTHVIVDEVHERSEESDFLLMILKDLLRIRKDLKVILMSATMNAKHISEYFSAAPSLEIPGRTFPVEQLFLEDILDLTNFVIEENSQYTSGDKQKFEALESQLDEILTETSMPSHTIKDENLNIAQLFMRYKEHSKLTCKNIYMMDPDKINAELIENVLEYICEGDHDWPKSGSILIFLPGISEISTVLDHLRENQLFNPRNGKFLLLPLHSTLSNEDQSAIFKKAPKGVRKIVLSTNIAETSITIDDCVFVIDCGKMKEKRFDSGRNMESLDMVWVSRANALQRKGRAGRVMPGICVHLYTAHRYRNHLLGEPVPEIHRIPLEPLILRIKMMELFYGQTLYEVLGRTLEPPAQNNITSAVHRLRDVGALDLDDNLTPLGHHLAALPVDVRIGKLMLLGAIFHCVDSALTVAACLSYKTPFCSPFGKKDQANARKKLFCTGNSDQLTVLRAYQRWQEAQKQSRLAASNFAEENYLSVKTLVTLADIKQQLLELLVSIGFVPVDLQPSRNTGKDRILEITGPELNANSTNLRLLSAILSAALYPNIVKVFTPEKTFQASASGAIPRLPKPEDMRFKTKVDGFVHIHPSSVNHSVAHFASPYLVFQEKVKTSKVFIRDCSMVSTLPLVLFSSRLEVELRGGDFILSLEGGWILFLAESHRIAEMLKYMRQELLQLLEEKIKDPYLNLVNHENGNKIINTIVHIISRD